MNIEKWLETQKWVRRNALTSGEVIVLNIYCYKLTNKKCVI